MYIEVDGWKSHIQFSASHLLPGHKRCGVLHGHTYALHIKVFGKQDDSGFIIDFYAVKQALRELAECLDHKMLIPQNNTHVTITDDDVNIVFEGKRYLLPRQDCMVLPLENITVEFLAGYLIKELCKKIDIPKNVTKVMLGVDEGMGQGAWIEHQI